MKNFLPTFYKPFVFIVLFLFGMGSEGHAQNFVQLFDYSGNVEGYQAIEGQLQAAADELVAAFPSEFQGQIKVYDFGFYLHQEDYDGFGYPEEFEKVIDEKVNSEYYLVFGRQTDQNGANDKVWVELKLPESGVFQCLTESLRGIFLNETINRANSTSKRFENEKSAIENLRITVNKIKNCCTNGTYDTNCGPCMVDLAQMRNYLVGQGFLRVKESQIILSTANYSSLQSQFRIEVAKGDLYFDLTNGIESLLNKVPGEAKVSYFDENSCENFSNFSALELGGLEYVEDLVVFSFGGELELYTKISSKPAENNSRENASRMACPPCAYFAYIVIEEALKRMIMGASGAAMYVVVTVVIEFWIGDYPPLGNYGLYDAFIAKDFTSAEELWRIATAFASGTVSDYIYVALGTDVLGEVLGYLNTQPFQWNTFTDVLVESILIALLSNYAIGLVGDITEAIKAKVLLSPAAYFVAWCIDDFVAIFKANPVDLKYFGKWLKAWIYVLYDKAELRGFKENLSLVTDYIAKFPNDTYEYMRWGIQQMGFRRWCFWGLGCFVKDTPILMANNPFKNVATGMALAAMPLVAPIQNVQVDDMVKAYHHEEMYLTASNDADHIYVPGWQDYDYLDITPETWQVGKFVITEEDGSVVEIEANRPKKWFVDYELKEKGDKAFIVIEEMSIADYAVLQEIRSTDIDTRDFSLNEEGEVDRPVITTYKRIATEISDYTFSNGQVISCTPNHPFYSSDRQAYIPVEELTFGEAIKTSGEREVKFIGGKSREKGESVFNFEVWREHNYFVGSEGSESFMLVHNSCGWMWNKIRTYGGGIKETCLDHIKRLHLSGSGLNKSHYASHINDANIEGVLQRAVTDYAGNASNMKFIENGYSQGKHWIIVDMSPHADLLDGAGNIGKYISQNGATQLNVKHILMTVDDNLDMINAFPTNKILSDFP